MIVIRCSRPKDEVSTEIEATKTKTADYADPYDSPEATAKLSAYAEELLFRLHAKHRKRMPTALERLVWGFGDGSTIGVAETPIGRIGSVICWENYMPLLRAAIDAQGIELYSAP